MPTCNFGDVFVLTATKGACRTSPPAGGDGGCVGFPKQSRRSYEEQKRPVGGATLVSALLAVVLSAI